MIKILYFTHKIIKVLFQEYYFMQLLNDLFFPSHESLLKYIQHKNIPSYFSLAMEMPISGTFLARYANLHFFKHRGKRLHALINMKEVRHTAN